MAVLLIPGLLLIGIASALISFPWRERRLGASWRWLALTPIPAILSYAWGWAFAVEPGAMPPPRHWHENALLIFLALSLVFAVVVPAKVTQARPFAISVCIAMLGLTFLTGLLSAMRVSGAWM